MRLLAEVRREFGCDLGELTVHRAPTIEAMAREVNSADNAPGARPGAVVAVRASGARTPFFIAGIGAGPLVRNLAGALPEDRPVYALIARATAEEPPSGDLALRARNLIAELRQIQPQGPYLLGSFCNQSALVLEMAQQLVQSGCSVPLLVMLESKAPGGRTLMYRLRRAAFRESERLKRHWGALRSLPRRQAHRYLLELATNWFRRRMRAARRAKDRLILRGYAASGRPAPGSLRESRAANSLLARRYVPQPFPNRVAVFVGAISRYLHDRTLGWSNLARGGVDVLHCVGSHTQMLREPQVADLGGKLEECLASAEASVHTLPRETGVPARREASPLFEV
jgi:thioesterase domain-containing protein